MALLAEPIINYMPFNVFTSMLPIEKVPPTDMDVMQSPSGSLTFLHFTSSINTVEPNLDLVSDRL